MEASCWSPLDNCQVVPNFDNQTSVDSSFDDMDSTVSDLTIDYDNGQHVYCQDFENFCNVNFDNVFYSNYNSSIDQIKYECNNQQQLPVNQVPLDQPVMIKTESVENYNSNNVASSCAQNGHISRPQSLNVETDSTTSGCDFSGPPLRFPMSAPEDGIEIYHDLIMRHLVQDIQATCDRLNISADPRCWSVQDTQKWLVDMAQQYQLVNLPYEKLIMPGHAFCTLGLDSLKQVYQQGGELVHAQLNLWTTASDYSMRHQNGQQSANLVSKGREECFVPSAWPAQIAYQPTAAVPPYAYPPLIRYPSKHECKSTLKYPTAAPIGSPQTFGAFLPSPSSDSGISTDMDEYAECESLSPLSSPHVPNTGNNIHLWQFLRELLDNQEKYSHCVRWIDRTQGIFKIEDSHKLAKLWGQRKNRPAMNYDKLSRSLRQYYRKGILKKTPRSQRLVYQFLAPYHIC